MKGIKFGPPEGALSDMVPDIPELRRKQPKVKRQDSFRSTLTGPLPYMAQYYNWSISWFSDVKIRGPIIAFNLTHCNMYNLVVTYFS